jgi:preprotein translocase subunit SecF
MQIFHNPQYNFMRWRWHAIALSWVVILAGLAMVYVKGVPLGVEFSGGTIVVAQFDTVPDPQQVRAALDKVIAGGGENALVQQYGDPSLRQLSIRVPQVGEEKGGALSQTADQVMNALKQANLGRVTEAGREVVGPIVGRDLTRRGLLATVFALAGILAYIALRFQLSFAVGAVVATIHDLLVTLAFLAFFRYDLSLNVIAAVLTITGYSVNDTIVIFDRVREDLRMMRRESIDTVVNLAVNQTLGRTVLTAGTTLLSVIALFFFGGEVLHGFAFTMLVGIITGTYSSVFIAGAIVTLWRRGTGGKKFQSQAPVTPAPAQNRGTRKERKARAS